MIPDIYMMIGVMLGLATGHAIAAISTRLFRRWKLPKTKTWLETTVLSTDGPIELKHLEYRWSGYTVTLQWDDINRTAISRRNRLASPELLKTFVEGVKSGIFLATATESPSTAG